MYYRSTVTSKGQITIPRELRDKFKLRKGDRVTMTATEEGIVLKPELNPLQSLRGLLRNEIELEKAATFIEGLRREWRLESG